MKKSSNNVIPFPNFSETPNIKKKKNLSRKEADDNVEETKRYYVQQTLNVLTPIIFGHLELAGFAPDDPDDIFSIKEGAFILESIRSRMCTHYGLYHPFQRLVDKTFIPDETDSELLTIANNIVCNFEEK